MWTFVDIRVPSWYPEYKAANCNQQNPQGPLVRVRKLPTWIGLSTKLARVWNPEIAGEAEEEPSTTGTGVRV